jgi:hypothetical protein
MKIKKAQLVEYIRREVQKTLKEFRGTDELFGQNGPAVYDEYAKEEMLEHYLIAALWSSIDFSDDPDSPYDKPLDEDYDVSDVSEETRAASKEDIDGFVDLAGGLLDYVDPEQAGHDFWLTRNGHGTGFWDRDYPEDAPEGIGDKLSEIAQTFGGVDLYSHEGQIYGT